MPTWDRFKELCNLQFGPAVRNTRLSELARLPFTSTVQDYSARFNAVLCHARNLSAPQKAELFVGGLPEHIKVDVELREPQDLQTAMHLARAFERRAHATMPATGQRGAWPPQRPGLPVPPRPLVPPPVATGAAAIPATAGSAAQKHGHGRAGAYPVSDTYPIRICLGYGPDTYPRRIRVS